MTNQTTRRPRIGLPARFSASASALRFEAVVMARRLADAVYAAGGEPVILHPVAPIVGQPPAHQLTGNTGVAIDPSAGFSGIPAEYIDEVRTRISFLDGIILPGGGDVSPVWAGQAWHESHYDVDAEQDAFDFALADIIVRDRIPTLAICRGMQLLNVALGGTIHFDMATELSREAHRHRVEMVDVQPDTSLSRLVGSAVRVSCYHHQCVREVAPGWQVVAVAADGTVEAMESAASEHLVAVQWHPEDTFDTDPQQFALFTDLVERARARVR